MWIQRELFNKTYDILILTHLEAQNGPKIWTYGPIFYTPKKVAPQAYK